MSSPAAVLNDADAQTISEPDPEPESEDEGPDDLSKDVIFDILKNQRRRYVLHHLKSESGPVRLGDLAEQVAAWENDTEIAQLSSKQRKRVYVGLYQGHLPKMDDANVIEFNQDRGIVELTETAEQLEDYLDDGSEESVSWSKHYLGVAALSTGLLLIGWIGVFGVIPVVVWAALSVGMFVGLAVAHAYHESDLDAIKEWISPVLPADRAEQA